MALLFILALFLLVEYIFISLFGFAVLVAQIILILGYTFFNKND